MKMNTFEFLNQPIVLALLSLTVGGYLFSLLSDRRARKDKIRDKAIEFLGEVSNDINAVTAKLFGIILSQDLKGRDYSALNKVVSNLLTKRMSVQVKSEAFLKSAEFYPRYYKLTRELYQVRELLIALTDHYDIEQVTLDIQEYRQHLRDFWPLEDEKPTTEIEPPFDELFLWTQMIVNRAFRLLSSNLRSVLR